MSCSTDRREPARPIAGDGDGKGWLDRTTRSRDTLPGHQPRSLQETHALDLAQFSLYFAAALLLALTPGPGIFYVAARTLAGGRAEGVASSIGTGIGGMVHVLAGGVGVSAIVLASAELFALLKFLGAGYLAWIGIRTFRAARSGLALPAGHEATATATGARGALREGILVEALNPKTAAFFLAFVPQFVNPAAGSVGLQFMLLGTVSVVLNTLADIAVAFAAGRLRDGAAARQALVRRLQQASGATMIALGIGLAMARRPA
jgi:threonine/homoserine/homoserine lactone efflux protein